MFLSRLILLILLQQSFIARTISQIVGDSAKIPQISQTPQSICSYRITCDIKMKRDDMDQVSPLCTALASSNNTEANIQGLKPLRTQVPPLPFMRVYKLKYEQWDDVFKNAGELTIDTISQAITNDGLCAVAFDKMYSSTPGTSDDKERSDKIVTFFCQLKERNPGILFGIVLPKDGLLIHHAFDVATVDVVADFYIAKTLHYRKCFYKVDLLSDENKKTTYNTDLEDSIKHLQNRKYDLSKTLLTIDINAYSFKVKVSDNKQFQTHTYGELCSHKMSKHRHMCTDTLEQFFNKAKLAFQYKMLGIYVVYLDSDDVGGKCGCSDEQNSKNYPILKVMAKALDGAFTSGVLNNCNSFGKPQPGDS
ncbi:Glycoside hydrolase superfamily [Cinara cedri]|uniref:Glycoside hydrolase superfamily n=1 Tax=Cinara cedri TaxID=506608 RepID=A0A5E4MH76_9HEMI|nr:Glycoside hydrolase superfamily [Cinara cedri]